MDHRRGGERENEQGVYFFESSSPRFFMIILHETIQRGKLMIPKRFSRKCCTSDFSENQHQTVSLKLPSGDVWDVEMNTRDDHQLCLQRGWPEFVDFYGIKPGHFLTFKFKKRGMINVRIYDSSAAEIMYPIKSSDTNGDHGNIHLEEDQSRRDVEPQMPNESPNPPQSPAAQDEVVPTSSTENSIKVVDDTDVESHSENKTKSQMSNRRPESHRSRGGTNRRTYKQQHVRAKRDRSLDGGSCFKSRKRNPCFSIVMRPSYVKHKELNVPAEFFMKRLALENRTAVELCNSDRRSWTVRYFYGEFKLNRRRCRLSSGWRGFVKDNELVEGDVCVFELIKSTPIVFHVSISRARKDQTFAGEDGFDGSKPGKSIQCPNSDKLSDCGVIKKTTYNSPPGQREKDRAALDPSFSIVMQPSYVRKGFVNVPRRAFMGQIGPKSNSIVKLCNSEGRSWAVKYHCTVSHDRQYHRLWGGWREFVKDNNLEEGDLCVFKLTKPTLVMFHVTIRKDAPFHNTMQGKRKREDHILCSRPWMKLKPQPEPASASNCASKFRTVMTQRYTSGANLSIPKGVAKRMFMCSKETVKNMKLEVDDRTWNVKALYYPKYDFGKITAGWSKFIKENFIEVGDICSFELLDFKKSVIRVSIQRGKMTAD